jgi:hypothetical protein
MLGPLLGTTAAAGLSASSPLNRIKIGDSTLDVVIDGDQFELGRTALLDWVTRSATAVTAYFGRFPVAQARVHITITQHGRVSHGVSLGDGVAHCRISVGVHATAADLYNDWELTLEMIHFGFPSSRGSSSLDRRGYRYLCRADRPILHRDIESRKSLERHGTSPKDCRKPAIADSTRRTHGAEPTGAARCSV